jgi:hypothetical protein
MTQDGDRRDNGGALSRLHSPFGSDGCGPSEPQQGERGTAARSDLLGALVDLAREQAVSIDDPRWEQLARGTLSRDEEADLRELAETNPNAGFLYEACQPVDERTKDNLVAEIAAGVQADPAHGALAGDDAHIRSNVDAGDDGDISGARVGLDSVALSERAPLAKVASRAVHFLMPKRQTSRATAAGSPTLRRGERLAGGSVDRCGEVLSAVQQSDAPGLVSTRQCMSPEQASLIGTPMFMNPSRVADRTRPAGPRRSSRAGALGVLALSLIPMFLLIASRTGNSPTRTDQTIHPVQRSLRPTSSLNSTEMSAFPDSVLAPARAAIAPRVPSPSAAKKPSSAWLPPDNLALRVSPLAPSHPPLPVAANASHSVDGLNESTRDAGRQPTYEFDAIEK